MAKYDLGGKDYWQNDDGTYEDEDGIFVFRTVGGRIIRIHENQSLPDAMKKSGKFESAKKVKAKGYSHKIDEDYEERLSKYKEIQKDANKRYDKGEIDKEERNKLIDDAHDKYIKQKEKSDFQAKQEEFEKNKLLDDINDKYGLISDKEFDRLYDMSLEELKETAKNEYPDSYKEKTLELTDRQKKLLDMKKSGEFKELLGDNDEKSMKEAEDRLRNYNENPTKSKVDDSEEGKKWREYNKKVDEENERRAKEYKRNADELRETIGKIKQEKENKSIQEKYGLKDKRNEMTVKEYEDGQIDQQELKDMLRRGRESEETIHNIIKKNTGINSKNPKIREMFEKDEKETKQEDLNKTVDKFVKNNPRWEEGIYDEEEADEMFEKNGSRTWDVVYDRLYEKGHERLNETSSGSNKPQSEKEMLKDLSQSQRDTTGVDFDWKASDEKLKRLGSEINDLESKIEKMPKNARMKSEENKQSMSKLGESLNERSEREVQKLKNYIRDNYDNPEDFLKDYDAETAAAKKGTRLEKFQNAKGYMDINEAIEARGKNDVQRIVNELKKENEYNDKIIADYERKKAKEGKASKVAERLGLKKDDDFERVSKELKEISTRTGRSDLTSEAGKRWDELYKQDKNNVSRDLGDNYHVSVGYDGTVQMSSSHPYDDTNYSFAQKYGDQWMVVNPIKGEYKTKMFNSREEALAEMKSIDNHIKGGDRVMSYEGITKHYQSSPRSDSNKPNTAYTKAFNEYKKKHPNSKITLDKFIDMSEGK